MLNAAGLDEKFWGEAILTATYLKNRSPTEGIHEDKTPEEAWGGWKPNLSHLRVFGCTCSVLLPEKYQTKMGAKSWMGVLMGYSPRNKAYRVWNPEKRKVEVARNVKFFEAPVVYTNRTLDMHPVKQPVEGEVEDDDSEIEGEVGAEETSKNSVEVSVEHETEEVQGNNEEEGEEDLSDSSQTGKINKDNETQIRKSNRISLPPKKFSSDTLGRWKIGERELNLAYCYMAESDEPKTLREALSGPEKEEWRDGWKSEMESQEKNGTWEIVDLPQGRKVVGCKYVFKKKKDLEGNVKRYKVRLVAQGFTQEYGIDYQKTFAPVLKYCSLRLLFAIVVKRGMTIHQMDVETAFLHGKLEEEIYMNSPEGYCIPEGKVLLLKKSLYGLKQAPLCWNKRINEYLVSLGFKRLFADPAVYSRGAGKKQIIVGLYVDDLLLFSQDMAEIAKVKAWLSREFPMKDLGVVSQVLGIKVSHDKKRGWLRMDQESYCNSLLQKYRMEEAKESRIPLIVKEKLTRKMCPVTKEEREEMATIPYRSALGSLMYLMVSTRPDLAASVSILSRFMDNPGQHWEALKRVLRYVKHTRSYSLTFCKKANGELEGSTDSDWAGCEDTRRSTTGYVFTMCGGAISWSSQRQSTVALSATEAEYMASTQGAREAVWLRRFLKEIGEKQESVQIYSDNQSSMRLMRSGVYHGRTKHIDVRHHYVRDLITEGLVKFSFLPTSELPADVLTKASK